ncbi:DUF551 domain-containing protein [Escherichia coli]|uniref:Valyl-tRNA synthetase n=1 Tax=Escherichia coli TaxID=562 RepID=A0A2S8JMP8_ECOLX|nr:DUF551 domain-containing protein [Escherichia coli]EFC1617655.1 DUF551 domain-containing protein [Escherichia coli]EIH9501479.1 DUF551 domain-containing protein [Escherichia coli]PPA51894.1 DUF551 domain-containing protein [Escherichia coli]PQP28201.1 DUF551 domain-containing protein [Escherichia coli]
MTTISRERIEQYVNDPRMCNVNDEIRQIARIALASLEAEPVAWECGENIILFNPDTVEAYAKRAEISPKPLYAASPVSVTPDSWISCSERMPEKGQNVLISVNFDSSLVEPLICSARYTGSTFRRGDATIKPGNGIEQATHWMPLPEPPQEANQ